MGDIPFLIPAWQCYVCNLEAILAHLTLIYEKAIEKESQHHATPICRLVFTLLLLLSSGTVHPLLTRSWQSAATSVLRSSMPPMT